MQEVVCWRLSWQQELGGQAAERQRRDCLYFRSNAEAKLPRNGLRTTSAGRAPAAAVSMLLAAE